ncbi:YybH family protein [Carboxylicivirga taeanensis]|uniref:YybH family protein n=1 Tax=Carboxylicivirga taeanensis TaxID=1416875 RepID=UPI003F6DE412
MTNWFSLLLIVSLITFGCRPAAQERVLAEVSAADKMAILNQMEASRLGWNKGDFEQYMQVYWQSDSLCFMGLNNLTYGWDNTLRNYQKGYPTAEHRGALTYSFKRFTQLAEGCILVIGSFHLKRQMGDAEGNFSLIWKQIEGQWRIVLDHT